MNTVLEQYTGVSLPDNKPSEVVVDAPLPDFTTVFDVIGHLVRSGYVQITHWREEEQPNMFHFRAHWRPDSNPLGYETLFS